MDSTLLSLEKVQPNLQWRLHLTSLYVYLHEHQNPRSPIHSLSLGGGDCPRRVSHTSHVRWCPLGKLRDRREKTSSFNLHPAFPRPWRALMMFIGMSHCDATQPSECSSSTISKACSCVCT